ncbi:uncharacterized protein B0P05DRAFT_555232 [Gilbertella persicaria]|uniref:uncharacterized protein n=1 Tax=Gilbertella persicaria TaxID=101096 RepID=UPI0022210903|nr:uncharacterized protein B0P05DRAFT_555232 [Gilbertella persicaria]KAI8063673.1 hypothetical protein B0P05DRAFT_555232 [Gilbertella persicaria]
MSNDIIPNCTSPSLISTISSSSRQSVNPPSPQLDNSLLWSSIEELAFKTTKNDTNTFSCLDIFIKEPDSDLVELVQNSETDYALFQSLITSTLNQNCETQIAQKQTPQHFTPYPQSQQGRRRKTDDHNYFTQPIKKSSLSRFYDDSMNAHLLRELLRQTSNKQQEMILHKDAAPYYHLPTHIYPSSTSYYTSNPSISKPSSSSSYYKKSYTPSKKNYHPYYYRSNHSSNRMAQYKPIMYSSELTQAQLLEIQAISRAQQDFIRAREQQEAEKEMMMKHQHKK